MRALFCLIAFALICGAFAQTNTTFCLSNGCSYADAVSATTITQASNKYTPPCIKVAMDTTVTFEMDFSFHPLRSGPVVGGVATDLKDESDLIAVDDGTTSSQLVGSWAAIPFYCDNHFGSGMMGVIYVGDACDGIVAPQAAPTTAPTSAPTGSAPTATPTTSAPSGSAPVKAPAKANSATGITVGAAALIAGLAMF